MGRANLHIVTDAKVTRVVIDGKTARGVEYTKGGLSHRVTAEAEVVLSAGTYRTPHILMHSGIGPGDHLRDFGIDPVHHLPGVGQNLQDHLGSFVQRVCSQPVSILETTKPWGQVKAALRYGLTGAGPLSHYPAEKMAFLKTDPALARPDLQFFIGPFLRPPAGSSLGPGAMKRHGYCISWCQLRPVSRGRITLSSGDPLSTPRVLHNYLGTEQDRDCQRRAVALARELHGQSPFDPYRGEELEPGPECVSQDAVDQYIQQSCHTHFHPAGTAAMGQDASAVVDGQLCVHGIENLRVVDASIMPRLVGANTNIPAIMIAEKASDMIRNRPPLPPAIIAH